MQLLLRHGCASLSAAKRLNFVILGPPGVGKGTYGALIAEWLALAHISSGDLVRNEIASGTELGRSCEKLIDKGRLVSDPIIAQLMRARLESRDAANGALFDGFPRRAEQVPILDKMVEVTGVLLLSLREDVLIEKAVKRRVCAKCGKSYNLAHIVEGALRMPAILPKADGQCDRCGGKLVQRSDDTLEVVRARLEDSKQLSRGVERVYEERGLLQRFTLTSGVDDMWPKLKSFVTHHYGV